MISDSKKQKPTSTDTTGEPAIAVAVSNHESPITNHNLSNHTANTDDDTTVIKIRGLTNRFGSQTVHDGLDLDVRRGEILGVVGGSGTGKSVLLRTILGLRRPDAGSVHLFGKTCTTYRNSSASRSKAVAGCCSRTARCSLLCRCSTT